jgi:hypothetical protein
MSLLLTLKRFSLKEAAEKSCSSNFADSRGHSYLDLICTLRILSFGKMNHHGRLEFDTNNILCINALPIRSFHTKLLTTICCLKPRIIWRAFVLWSSSKLWNTPHDMSPLPIPDPDSPFMSTKSISFCPDKFV